MLLRESAASTQEQHPANPPKIYVLHDIILSASPDLAADVSEHRQTAYRVESADIEHNNYATPPCIKQARLVVLRDTYLDGSFQSRNTLRAHRCPEPRSSSSVL
jgi:hypothetical protein